MLLELKGKEYYVMGGGVTYGSSSGLGYFNSCTGVSCCGAEIGLRSVSSKEIAQHISTYFGKLLFDIQYGGTNCDWKWV